MQHLPSHMGESARALNSFTLEQFEPRRLLSVVGWSSDSVSDISETYFATIQFGDNGYPYGTATGVAGQGEEQDSWTFNQWDSNPYDGIDSGWRNVSFSINSAGNSNSDFVVDGNSGDGFSVGPTGTISTVTVRADAMYGGLEFDWSSITVKFYHNGSLVDTIQPSAFSAGDTSSTSDDPSETGIVVTTSATNANGVSFTGSARVKAAEGTYPGGTDVFGQILVS